MHQVAIRGPVLHIYQEVNTHVSCTINVDNLPNDLVGKMDHVVHFRSYVNSRVTPSEKVVMIMNQSF